jgi:sugar/nucleoside kinase (ribokinase family)
MPGVPRPGRARRAGSADPPRLVALGDLLLDVAVMPARPPEVGTDVPGTLRFRAGGSAANVARAFAGLGGEASFVGSVGDDGWGRRLVGVLRAEGVRARVVRVPGVATARLLALVDRSGERTFVTERGAADRLAVADVQGAWLRGAAVLHVSAYSLFVEPAASAALHAADLAHAAGALVSVDLASRAPLLAYGRAASWERIASLRPDVLFANRGEAVALAGPGRERAARRLAELAPLVVIKDGAVGCAVVWRDPAGGVADLEVAASPIDVADSTGAGDAFAAGFLLALVRAAGGGTSGGAAAPAGVPGAAGARWSPTVLRRAALAGHRSAAELLRRPRPDLGL